MAKMIRISSVLPASKDRIWDKLTLIETLQHIAAPLAYFSPVDNATAIWQKGGILQFRLHILGFIPLGIHRIQITEFDISSYIIRTCEGNRLVPLWNHTIRLIPLNESETHYFDEVEIDAGIFTGFVVLWSRLFYRHRQRKWRRLLC